MKITAIKTRKIVTNDKSIFEIIDESLPVIEDGSIIAITSKIISICEGSVVPINAISKEDLIVREADKYLPATLSKYGHHFTITNNTLIPTAGIDR